MAMPYFQVNVPTVSSTQPERRGSHLFVGPAGSGREALRIARETCDAELDAQISGSHIPHRRPGHWRACGIRPGWEFDWAAATVSCWEDTYFLGSSRA